MRCSLTTIGIQFSVTAVRLGIFGYTTLIAGVGGSPFYFWGFLVAAVSQLLVAVSLAELSSAYPHTSGKDPAIIRFQGLLNYIFAILRANLLDCQPKSAGICMFS